MKLCCVTLTNSCRWHIGNISTARANIGFRFLVSNSGKGNLIAPWYRFNRACNVILLCERRCVEMWFEFNIFRLKAPSWKQLKNNRDVVPSFYCKLEFVYTHARSRYHPFFRVDYIKKQYIQLLFCNNPIYNNNQVKFIKLNSAI